MGKHSKYSRNYRKDWEKEQWAKGFHYLHHVQFLGMLMFLLGWLQHISKATDVNLEPLDCKEAYCKVCRISLRAHYADLKRHSKTKMHIQKTTQPSKNKQTILNYGVTINETREQKYTDLKLAVYIAMHSAVNSINHLGELLKTFSDGGKYSTLENLKIHRTKCSSLIKNVIAPVMLNELVADIIENEVFSLIVDESTDVAVIKYICLCVKYFSKKEGKIITDFLGIIEIYRATAEDLFNSINEYLNNISLPLENLISIGTDGASNLCGKNNSLYTKLKEKVPNLILLKCTCHSLHICGSKASEELPASLDFLAREVYNWFSCSPVRRLEYQHTFDLINTGLDKNKFKRLVQLSATRWLSRYEVIKTLLLQWTELQTHFNLAAQKEKCFTARIINDMLKDSSNKLYFIFLKPVLAEINHLNISFQSERLDPGSAYEKIYLTVMSLSKRILKPVFLREYDSISLISQISAALGNELAMLPLEAIDFGLEFSENLTSSRLTQIEKNVVMQRCANFIRKLLIEMSARLPSNFEFFKTYKMLSPNCCLGLGREQILFAQLPIQLFFSKSVDIDIYEAQWRKLPFVNWKEEFNTNTVPDNIEEFWLAVWHYKNASGIKIFEELSLAVLKALCIPISNAVVERVFSVMNLSKTKIRNRMSLQMLESILRIKIHLNIRSICCRKFKLSSEMLLKFNSSMYKNTDAARNTQTDSVDYSLETAVEIVNSI